MATSTHSLLSTAGVEDAGITNASQTGLGITGSITLMAWLRPNPLGLNQLLATKWSNVGNQRGYIFQTFVSDRIGFEYSDDGIANFAVSSPSVALIAVNRWVHIAAVFISATPEVQFYINGRPDESPVAIGGSGSIFSNTADFRVGNVDGGVSGQNFRGHLDEVKVYDDERTAAEIFQEYLLPPAAGANLQAGYSFDNVFTDISGNGNTLVNNGTVFVEREVHGYTAGRGSGQVAGTVILPIVFRMRADDAGLGRRVYWNSKKADGLGDDYTGPGPLTDVVVSEKLAAT